MIKRVGGGGMGMVNPMGWYDANGTPGPSPVMAPKAIDHALSRDNDQVWGGVETPDQKWAKPESEETGSGMRPSKSALGLMLGARGDGDVDDDPDQVFTASPEDEHKE